MRDTSSPSLQIGSQLSPFFTRSVDAPNSFIESFWELSKLQPATALHEIKNDPIALSNEHASDIHKSTLTELISRGGKRYIDFPNTALPLPAAGTLLEQTLVGALEHRHSSRDFGASPISLENLSSLLFYTYGWKTSAGENLDRRKHVPSAGALYPLEIYVGSLDITGLDEKTLYHYRPTGHVLEQLKVFSQDEIFGLFQGVPWLTKSKVIIFITGVLPRLTWKYENRALRCLLLDSGHAAQNACLVAAPLGLSLCPLLAFYDDRVHDFLDVDGVSEIMTYALAVGSRGDPMQAA